MTDRQIKIGIFRLAHPFIIFDRALTARRINASDQATLHCERRGQMAYWKLSLLGSKRILVGMRRGRHI
jgi:hypothetical protein